MARFPLQLVPTDHALSAEMLVGPHRRPDLQLVPSPSLGEDDDDGGADLLEDVLADVAAAVLDGR